MRIGIDARPLKYKEYNGIPKTEYEILVRWMDMYPENEYFLISNTQIALPVELPKNWHRVIVPGICHNNGTLWQIYKLSSIVRKLNLDVYWGTNYMLPLGQTGKCRFLLSIYDLAFMRFKKTSSFKTAVVLKMFLKRSSKKADYIHVISNSTKNDVIELLNANKKRVVLVYLGADKKEKVDNPEIEIDLPKCRYFVVLGTIEPRKNPVMILKAFEYFCKKSSDDIHLVFAGKKGWRTEQFETELQNSSVKNKIHILGYVSDEVRSYLLQNSEALLFPSLYEGFGLPILEGMNYQIPVITTKISSMPEVGGDAALYLDDCRDYREMARLMHKVLKMDEAQKKDMALKMRRNVSRFSWDDCAREVMMLVKKTAGQ